MAVNSPEPHNAAQGACFSTGLRRVDWRFLLPSPDGIYNHLVLLGAPEALSQQLLQHGIARQISRSLRHDRSANALAVLSNARVDLAEIPSCLAPNGVLYYEVDRRLPGQAALTPWRLVNRLRSAALKPTGIYWVAPDFDHCRRYIPLDRPEPFAWYLSTLYLASSPLYRFLEIAMRLSLGKDYQRFAFFAHCYAVTAVPEMDASTALPSVLGHADLPVALHNPDVKTVLLTSGQDDGSRVVLLPFAPGSRQPAAVIKLATRPDFNINIRREQSALAAIRSLIEPGRQHTVPTPLHFSYYGELAVGVESCAEGQPLYISSGRWPVSFRRQVSDLTLPTQWLSEFHRRSQVERLCWKDAAHDRWIETPLRRYADTFGLTGGEEQLFEKTRAYSRTLSGAFLPIVWMHYDYSPWNIYRLPHDLTIIDWEIGGNRAREPFGPALYDLLYFITYWMHVVYGIKDEQGELAGQARLFVPAGRRDRYMRAAHTAIDQYLRALDMDGRFLPLILVYLWVEQALHHFDRGRLLGNLQPSPRAGNRSVLHVGVLAEAAEQLFRYEFNLASGK